jgi:hypothetical protein
MEISNVTNSLVQSQLSGAQLRNEIAYKVAAKALDATRAQGQMVLELLDGAAAMADQAQSASSSQDLLSNLGRNVDVQA